MAIEFWHWWLAGLILLALTPLAPLAVLTWVALAALLVGLLLLALPKIGIAVQLVLFAGLVAVIWVAWLLLRHGTVGGSPRRR